MDDSVLSPLVFLHRFFSVKFLVTNVALERAVVAMGAFVNLKSNQKNFKDI